MDLIAGFKEAIRVLLGLPADPGQPPDLLRLGLYPARVDVCNSDGSACDVTPDDDRISPAKNVPVRFGIPGTRAVIQPGTVVLLGWERGDPQRPYCTLWDGSDSVVSMVIAGGVNHAARVGDATSGHVHALGSATAGPYPVMGSTVTATDTIAENGGLVKIG
jgi:hypothetical protein